MVWLGITSCDPYSALATTDQSRTRLCGAILPRTGYDEAADHATTQRPHLVVDGKVDAGPETGTLRLHGSGGEIGFVGREEIAQHHRRSGRDGGVARGMRGERRRRDQDIQTGV